MSKENIKHKVLNNKYFLPSNDTYLKAFVKRHKINLMNQVVSSIQYAIKHKLDLIEVFQFKDSDFVITISKKDFSENLENIFSFYIKNELYEKCKNLKELQDKLKKGES